MNFFLEEAIKMSKELWTQTASYALTEVNSADRGDLEEGLTEMNGKKEKKDDESDRTNCAFKHDRCSFMEKKPRI